MAGVSHRSDHRVTVTDQQGADRDRGQRDHEGEHREELEVAAGLHGLPEGTVDPELAEHGHRGEAQTHEAQRGGGPGGQAAHASAVDEAVRAPDRDGRLRALLGQRVQAGAGAPALPGARCRGRPHLFDEQRPDEDDANAAARHTQALALCNRCPALTPCQSWFASLSPRKRPAGIVAGGARL
jgi:WhiB family redox-sensing transcriptional regulator